MGKFHVMALAAALGSIGLQNDASAAFDYVGSWIVGDGPPSQARCPADELCNPVVYSGQEAAALLFGGKPADYAISTVSANAGEINFSAWLDGWGDTKFLHTPAPQDFSQDMLPTGYSIPGGIGSSYSAYVFDHDLGLDKVNFAFRVSAVPEPESWVLALIGLGLLVPAVRGVARAR